MNSWPVSVQLPVQWGDLDAFQHVNNVVYLRWFESARIAYFEQTGVLEGMPGVGPILARQTIDYRVPLLYPDSLLASATVTKIGNSSFTMGMRIESATQGRIAAEGEMVRGGPESQAREIEPHRHPRQDLGHLAREPQARHVLPR